MASYSVSFGYLVDNIINLPAGYKRLISEFSQQLPFYEEKAEILIKQSTTWLNDFGFGEMLPTLFDPAEALSYIQRFIAAMGGIVSRYFLILLLVIFILVDVPRSLNKGNSAAGQITRTIQHYFAIKTFTSLLTGISNWHGF